MFKRNVVLVHFPQEGKGRVLRMGPDVEVMMIDDRGGRRQVLRWQGEEIGLDGVVELMGHGFVADAPDVVEGEISREKDFISA